MLNVVNDFLTICADTETVSNGDGIEADHRDPAVESGLDHPENEEGHLHTLVIHGLSQDWMEKVREHYRNPVTKMFIVICYASLLTC